MRFTVVVEEGESSFGAFVPDLPGCVAVGETREETLRLIKGAIELHLEGLKSSSPLLTPSKIAPMNWIAE